MDRLARATATTSALLAGGSGLLVWGARLVGGAAASGSTTAAGVQPAERLLVALAGLGLAAVGAWMCLGTLICLGDLARRRTILAPGLLRPRAVRLAILRACAPTLGAAVVCAGGPVVADTGDLGGLPLPERPVLTAPAERPAQHRSTDPIGRRGAVGRVVSEAELTVRPGDCLWSLAADLLAPRSTAADIDRGWRSIYRANRARVGPDPDLLRPGTRLVVPGSLRQSLPPAR